MEYIALKMVNNKLSLPPKIELPEGYSIRLFQQGDELHWARIAQEADEFDSIEDGLKYFNNHFGPKKSQLLDRCFLCCDEKGLPIGSSTAWSGDDDSDGAKQGMLHWVIVSKAHQGKGLCRPLVAAAMKRLFREYNSAYLTTQTYSFKGIRVYLDMGFVPVEEGTNWNKGWQLVWESTHHPKLIKYIEQVKEN